MPQLKKWELTGQLSGDREGRAGGWRDRGVHEERKERRKGECYLWPPYSFIHSFRHTCTPICTGTCAHTHAHTQETRARKMGQQVQASAA